ncbi:MAG: ABC transporter ATP-binding protein [Gemmatimonadota bacterium]
MHVRDLSKQYLIGSGAPVMYGNLRERLAGLGPALLRRLRLLRRSTKGADPGELIWALREVSFDIRPGEVVGLIGRNGAGKSTLLKVLSRITAPSAGYIEFTGRVGSLLEVGTGFHAELSGRENIFLNGAILGMRRAEIVAKLDAIVEFAEIERFVDTPVKHFSSGMYVRLAFAVAAHMETEILLVDEVLAVGDLAFQRKCLGKMGEVARSGRTVVFVSHNMGSIARLCDRGLVLDEGCLIFDGQVDSAIARYNDTFAGPESGPAAQRHVLFDETPGQAERFAVSRVEVLDTSGRPMPAPHTWDDVVLRVHCRCLDRIRGGVVLEVRHASGPRVLYLSTEPDRGQPVVLERGAWSVDCTVRRLPLGAGEYYVGVGLTIPGVENLWHRAEVGRMLVLPRDVYGSGQAPDAARGLVVPEYDWSPPRRT